MEAKTSRIRSRYAAAASAALLLAACGADPDPGQRVVGQTRFVSSPPPGGGLGGRTAGPAEDATGQPPPQNGAGSSAAPRAVEETDLYRLEGDRLYFLNGYRGLMVFDVSDPDHPQLLGRSPIFGWPVEMVVRNGVATVVVADWYGALDDGSPFHGSIVRGLDATNPADIRVLGEARLGGWVRDTRVVGDVLYAVSEDYGWTYGWGRGAGDVAVGMGASGPGAQQTIIVSSVSFAGGHIEAKSRLEYPGFGGVFHVNPDSILLAHDVTAARSSTVAEALATTELEYLDISDPLGDIVARGSIDVRGRVQGWGADNGRWNLDFADGRHARVIACAGEYWCDASQGYLLSIVDFTDPDHPVQRSELSIPATGWGIAARFDGDRLYLSPDAYTPLASGRTPFLVFDLADAAQPAQVGSLEVPGSVWNILLAPSARLFALGNDWGRAGGDGRVSLSYIDASDPAAPTLLGTATFGQGWAWTPAAGTFKAFTMDAARGLVVLPFSGWDASTFRYTNGLQLIEFAPSSIRTAGAALTRGWVERGIFVGDRLVSLSDTALAVIDFSNHDQPTVTAELTLARNVVSAQPTATSLAELSSDWWDNDVSSSTLRILPIADAEETLATDALELSIEGINARSFRNGELLYVVTDVRVEVPCSAGAAGGPRGETLPGDGGEPTCWGRAESIQVVDLAGGGAVPRGRLQLPVDAWSGYGWGWFGCYWYDWYFGAEVLQVGGDALAFRRWSPVYDANGVYVRTDSTLQVVDLSNPDLPTLASTPIASDPYGWWGNMRVLGSTLYASRYEWVETPGAAAGEPSTATVRYYVDRIDLSDRAHPVVASSINVPGVLVGGSETDPSLLYTIDYRWDAARGVVVNDFMVVRVVDEVAALVSSTTIDGWVGATHVVGDTAYFSAQRWDGAGPEGPSVSLHALDLSTPSAPADRVASERSGWGWLLGVVGDRALVTSGWGAAGLDVYVLASGQAPAYQQTVRTRGWSAGAATRQADTLYLASGYWGVQRIELR